MSGDQVLGTLVIRAITGLIATVASIRHLFPKKDPTPDHERLAHHLGLQYVKGYRGIAGESFCLLPTFRRGTDVNLLQTFRGLIELAGRPHPIVMGQCRYTQQLGDDNEQDQFFSYLVVRLPFAGVPDVAIRREGVLDKIATELSGLPDINFESAEFSRLFHVQSQSKRFAYDLLNAAAIEYLLRHKPSRIDIVRGHLLMSDGQSVWTTEQYYSSYQTAVGFLKCWPSHLSNLLDSGKWLDQ